MEEVLSGAKPQTSEMEWTRLLVWLTKEVLLCRTRGMWLGSAKGATDPKNCQHPWTGVDEAPGLGDRLSVNCSGAGFCWGQATNLWEQVDEGCGVGRQQIFKIEWQGFKCGQATNRRDQVDKGSGVGRLQIFEIEWTRVLVWQATNLWDQVDEDFSVGRLQTSGMGRRRCSCGRGQTDKQSRQTNLWNGVEEVAGVGEELSLPHQCHQPVLVVMPCPPHPILLLRAIP